MLMRAGAALVVVGAALGIALAGALAVGCRSKTPAAPAPGTAAPAAGVATAPPAAPAPSAALAASGPDPCPAICDRTRPLRCKRAAACRDTCREMRRIEACGSEMAAVLSCFARQPLSSWQCSEDGDAAMKEGFCDEQQGQFASCVQRGAAPPTRI